MTGKPHPSRGIVSHKPWRPTRVVIAAVALSALALSSCAGTSEVTEDVVASNGVIHVIDAMLVPADVDPAALAA